MTDNIDRIDIKEFQSKGYLQEVNRRFFHPLGLALEIVIERGDYRLGGIWDYRGDKAGVYFDFRNKKRSSIEKVADALRKKEYVDEQLEKYRTPREQLFGSSIEPIEGSK